MNIDNFDSGSGAEDVVREQLRQILPRRYGIYSGVINDRRGYTAGDVDVIVFNDIWFPMVKPPATDASRRAHYPIEGVYGVCEVKQSIDERILDASMEKLVVCHRLARPATHANRLVENKDLDGCFHGLKNPLYSAIIAVDLRDGVSMDALVERFFQINKKLKRLEIVRALCVLGRGTVTWSFVDDRGDMAPALFMREDLFRPIHPSYTRCDSEKSSALYHFVFDLSLHLYQSVLGAEDIAAHYGYGAGIATPRSPTDLVTVSHQPDQEWVNKLDDQYDGCGEIRKRDPVDGLRLSEWHTDEISRLIINAQTRRGSK